MNFQGGEPHGAGGDGSLARRRSATRCAARALLITLALSAGRARDEQGARGPGKQARKASQVQHKQRNKPLLFKVEQVCIVTQEQPRKGKGDAKAPVLKFAKITQRDMLLNEMQKPKGLIGLLGSFMTPHTLLPYTQPTTRRQPSLHSSELRMLYSVYTGPYGIPDFACARE